MTAGFGADPVHDVSSAAMTAAILASLILLPSSLIAFLWSKIYVVTSWSISGLCVLSVLVGARGAMLLLVFAFIQALIASAIHSRSEEPSKLDGASG
jgi:hypothetical protein